MAKIKKAEVINTSRSFEKYTIDEFKYFEFDGLILEIKLVTKDLESGNTIVATDDEFKNVVSRINITYSTKKYSSTFEPIFGVHLYILNLLETGHLIFMSSLSSDENGF